MNDMIKFGLIGAGGIAQSYVQAFRQVDNARISAVVDIRQDAADSLAENAGCRSFASYEDLWTESRPDAVIVCTPPSTHPEISLYFLDRGVPVLCEKPLAVDLRTGIYILDAAARSGTLFAMASKFRYVEDVVRAKSILTSGILGEVILFENSFTARVDMSRRWTSNPAISGGGVLIDNGTHSVDIMRYFLGPIEEVHAIEAKRIQDLPVEDTVRLFIRSKSGVVGTVDLSWSVNKELESYIDVYGSHGILRVGWQVSKYRHTSSSGWVVFGNGYNKIQALRDQVRNFCGAVRGEEPLRISPEDAIASVAVVEAAYRSLRDSHWIPVEPAGVLV